MNNEYNVTLRGDAINPWSDDADCIKVVVSAPYEFIAIKFASYRVECPERITVFEAKIV